MRTYQISSLAARSGVPAATLRLYEREGLLHAQRSASGYRVHDAAAVERLTFIAAGKHLGLPLNDIRELLVVWQSGLCAQVQGRLRPLLECRIADAAQQMLQLDVFAAQLGRARRQLDTAARPGRGDPGCPFLQQTASAAAARTASPGGAFTPLAPLDAPVACSLRGQARADQLGRWHALVADAAAVEELDCGVRVSLPVHRLSDAAGLAAAEQECCPFLAFHLHPDGTQVHLEIGAPAHASALLAELVPVHLVPSA